MIVLSAATYTLQLVLSAGTADVDVSYVDRTATAYPIGATEQTAATATTQTICSAPAASTSREIDWLTVKIKTVGGVVTIQKLNSSGSVTTQLISVTLLDEEVLQYTHGSGWCALDANGNRKEATSSAFGAITATSITDSGLTATRVVFSGGGGLLSDDSGFTFNTTGDILTVGAINVAGTTAPTTGWYNPSGTVLRTPNAVTLDAALTYGGVTLSNAVTGTGNMVLSASPTFTGTVSAAEITASGNISTSGGALAATKNANSDQSLTLTNTTAGTAAGVRVDLVGDASGGQLTIYQFNTSYSGTVFGVTASKLKAIFDNTGSASQTNGLLIGTAVDVPIYFAQNGSERGRFNSAGLSVTGTLGVSGLASVGGSSPASGDAGTAGTITWDASYIYVCTASGAWKRAALTGGY